MIAFALWMKPRAPGDRAGQHDHVPGQPLSSAEPAEHPVARQLAGAGAGPDGAGHGGLHGDHAGGEADGQHHEQRAAGPRAKLGLERRGDRVGVLAGQHGAEVGQGEDQAEGGEHDQQPAGEQGQADRLRQHVPGALDLLGDGAGRLEADEGEADERDDREERPEQPGAAVRGPRAAEQERERVRAVEEQQRDADPERGDQLSGHGDVQQATQELAADHVGDRAEDQDAEREQAGLGRGE